MENPIDEFLLDKIEDARVRKAVFFVGAGISVPSGVPDFKRLNEEVIRTLSNDELSSHDLELLSQSIRPEVMYQIAMDELGSGVLYSLEMFEGCEPNYYHYFLADAIRQGSWVFTTNPDNLIEVACEKRGMKPGVDFKTYYGHDNDKDFEEYLSHLQSGTARGACIFKLHGSIEDNKQSEEKYRTVRFALRQVGKGLLGPRREILEYFLKDFDFWFVGYSCRDDFSVLPVLSGTESDKDIYWFEYDGGPLCLLILDESRLQWEIEREQNRPLDEERNLALININETLLHRGEKYKFIGDLGTSMKNKIGPRFGIEIACPSRTVARRSEAFSRWATEREECERCVFLGRLFEEVRNWDRAAQYYSKVLDEAKSDSQRVRTKRRLADLYYRESIPGKEEEAVGLYQQCIDSSCDPLEKASLKASISNVLRRRGKDYFTDSYAKADEAKREFESILSEQDLRANLDYARCLNIYGLILYSTNRFEDATRSFIDSIDIKNVLGDVDGVAESENALSLVCTQEGRRLVGERKEAASRQRFLQAIDHARAALACRRKVGNHRGYAQNCRNLAWPYSELMKLASEENQRQEYFREAASGYKAGITSWNRFVPPPPVEIVLFNNLLAGLCIDFCYKTQDRGEKVKWAKEVTAIYKSVLQDLKRKEVARIDKRTPTAEQNLEKVRGLFIDLNLGLEAKEVDEVLAGLRGK